MWLLMADDLPARQPGSGLPAAVRDAAGRASRRRRPPDLLVLQRVRDALARLPDNAMGRHYIAVPGDCLACPRQLEERPPMQPRGGAVNKDHRMGGRSWGS
jgi:hypothetical protein